jgi:uncharacterized membrane protein
MCGYIAVFLCNVSFVLPDVRPVRWSEVIEMSHGGLIIVFLHRVQVNSLAAGALTGALYAASRDGGTNDQVAKSALTGAALATAAEFLRDL